MTWWQIALLGLGCYWLGVINATVLERERYMTWMSNSWKMLHDRMWWISMASQKDVDEVTLSDIAELNEHMVQTLNDYTTVFGRPYDKEELILAESDITDDDAD